MDKKKILKLDELLSTALTNKVFPCAAVGFSRWTGEKYERFEKGYGHTELTPEKRKLQKYDFFDLASLTKALTTVPLLLIFISQKTISFETKLPEIFTDCPSDKENITIRQLMSHCSGLPPHREYFHDIIQLPEADRKEALLQVVLHEELESEPGRKEQYSDLGFILLGFILEKIGGRSLDVLAEELLYSPVKLQNALVFPGKQKNGTRGYVCTEKCIWTQKMLSGQVHDDNCRAVGGVAGHAGLFGTLDGVLQMTENLLDQYQGRGKHPEYENDLLRQCMLREDGREWIRGFDTPSVINSSSGSYFSQESAGHLGFTGTSFWIDLQKQSIVVLLSNRVYYGRDNWQIREFRPLLHDLLMGF